MEYFSSKQGGSEICVQLYVKIYQQGFTKPYAFQKRERGFEFVSLCTSYFEILKILTLTKGSNLKSS